MKTTRLSICLLALMLLGAGCFGQKTPTASNAQPVQEAVDASADQAAQPAAAPDATSTDAAAKAAAPAVPKAVKKSAPSQPAAVSVLIGDTAFSPVPQVTHPGGKVVWTNKSSKNQTVHSVDTNLYDSGNIPPGKSWSHVFPATGSYEYYTASDVNMKGLIIVR